MIILKRVDDVMKGLCKQIVSSKIWGKISEKKEVACLFIFNHSEWKTKKYYSEHSRKFGKENKEVCFFLIRRCHVATGLLSCYLHFLGHILDKYEDIEQGKIIPVIDMYTEHFELVGNANDGEKKVNAWDYYFEPLSKYKVSEVLKSKNVLLSYGFLPKSASPFFGDKDLDQTLLRKILKIHNKFFFLKQALRDRFEKTYKKLIYQKRVLGTNIRDEYIALANGRETQSDEYKVPIDNHPVQEDIEKLINELDNRLKEYNCDYLFLFCETTFVKQLFSKHFGKRLITTDRKLIETDNLVLENYNKGEREKMASPSFSMVENNVDYLENIYLLSKCTSLYSSKSSGTMVALLWNNDEYEHSVIINKGKY